MSGVLFQGKSALTGGAYDTDSSLTVRDSQFLSNTALASGGGLSVQQALTATNVLFAGNTASSTTGLGGGVADNDYGDLRLRLVSPGIDAGDNSRVPPLKFLG